MRLWVHYRFGPPRYARYTRAVPHITHLPLPPHTRPRRTFRLPHTVCYTHRTHLPRVPHASCVASRLRCLTSVLTYVRVYTVLPHTHFLTYTPAARYRHCTTLPHAPPPILLPCCTPCPAHRRHTYPAYHIYTLYHARLPGTCHHHTNATTTHLPPLPHAAHTRPCPHTRTAHTHVTYALFSCHTLPCPGFHLVAAVTTVTHVGQFGYDRTRLRLGVPPPHTFPFGCYGRVCGHPTHCTFTLPTTRAAAAPLPRSASCSGWTFDYLTLLCLVGFLTGQFFGSRLVPRGQHHWLPLRLDAGGRSLYYRTGSYHDCQPSCCSLPARTTHTAVDRTDICAGSTY